MAETVKSPVECILPDIKPFPIFHQKQNVVQSASLAAPYVVVFRKHVRTSSSDSKPQGENSSEQTSTSLEAQQDKLNHKCECCGKTFKKKWQLIVHAKIHAREKSTKQRRRSKTKVSVEEKTEHRCVCGEVFPSKWFLSAHMTTHTGEKLKPYECEICNKLFRTKSHLNEHKNSHTGEKPYTCEICNSSYMQPASLIRHKKMHHSGGERKVRKVGMSHTCKVCNKLFSRRSMLIEHLNVHSNERLFKCDICDKSYRFSSSVYQHKKRVHRKMKSIGLSALIDESQLKDLRPHKCTMCPRRFKFLKNLAKHVNTHDGISDKKPQCEVCGKVFGHRHHMMKHVRVKHVGERLHVCEICDKSFSQNCHLVKHRLIHTGEKPFSCEICNRPFAVTSALMRHMKLHTGEKPHTCEICGKSFTEKRNADKHRLNHSKELDSSECAL